MPKPYERKPEHVGRCHMCGKDYTTTSANKRFCSTLCRLEFRRKVQELGECPWCHQSLLVPPAWVNSTPIAWITEQGRIIQPSAEHLNHDR